jgi:hypothetical protein
MNKCNEQPTFQHTPSTTISTPTSLPSLLLAGSLVVKGCAASTGMRTTYIFPRFPRNSKPIFAATYTRAPAVDGSIEARRGAKERREEEEKRKRKEKRKMTSELEVHLCNRLYKNAWGGWTEGRR